jgi:signal transduction histidine kinase
MISVWMIILVSASFIALLGISMSYYFAFRLYRSRYFLYIGIAWFLNAFYLVFEVWHPKSLNDFISNYEIPYLLSIPTIFLFYAAFCNARKRKISTTRYWITVGTILIAIISLYLFSAISLATNTYLRFIVMVFPGIMISCLILTALAYILFTQYDENILFLLNKNASPMTQVLDENIIRDSNKSGIDYMLITPIAGRHLRRARNLFAITFFFYGMLQLFYFAKMAYGNTIWFELIFYIALILKLFNGLGIPFIVLGDIRVSEQQMKIRTLTEEMGALTAGLEHDIRTPLSTALKIIRTMRARHKGDSIMSSDITKLLIEVTQIQAASEIILSVRETDDYYLKKFRRSNLIDIINIAVKEAKNKFEGQSIKIEYLNKRTFIMINGYPARLIQAFTNIITNGIEACLEKSPKEIPKIFIAFGVNTSSNSTIIKIKDCGCGIIEDKLSLITRPLYSTKNSASSNRGLGLYTADKIIRQHKGKINFLSDGTTYTEVIIELPLIEVENGRY